MEGGDKHSCQGGAQQQQQQRPPGPRPLIPGTAKESSPQPACLHQWAIHESQERRVSHSLRSCLCHFFYSQLSHVEIMSLNTFLQAGHVYVKQTHFLYICFYSVQVLFLLFRKTMSFLIE